MKRELCAASTTRVDKLIVLAEQATEKREI